MSVQTGAPVPSGPASSRFVDRARYNLDRAKNDPNPIWIRELRQSARLGRTPILLLVLTILTTLLIASIGGIVSTEASPAKTGNVIFQLFFSLAFLFVSLIGPAVAANSIASEREGRTWEAVILTGLPPPTIARGKFLAAYTAIGVYLVMLAPVGAIPFLFGGVTATEVVVAFVFLFVFALLSVAFGLAISSKMDSMRGAIVITLMLSFFFTVFAFFGLGWGASVGVHELWPNVTQGPVWLPQAYEHAPFGRDYVVFLFVLPIAAITLPAWFLYEVTIANLTSVTDDQSSGLKRWLLVASPVLAIALFVPVLVATGGDRVPFVAIDGTLLFLFFSAAAFLIQGDPVGPSRRVRMQWDRAKTSAFRRFLGPSVTKGAVLVLVLGVTLLGLFTIGSVAAVSKLGATTRNAEETVVIVLGYGIAFFVFMTGLAAFLRARAANSFSARVLLFSILFGVSVGPWIVTAIAGILSAGTSSGFSKDAWMIASPSPFYVIVMVDQLRSYGGSAAGVMIAGGACAVAWAGLGLVLLGAADRRSARIIREHERRLSETDRLLAEEDARAHETAEPARAPDAPGAEAPTDASPVAVPPDAPAGA